MAEKNKCESPETIDENKDQTEHTNNSEELCRVCGSNIETCVEFDDTQSFCSVKQYHKHAQFSVFEYADGVTEKTLKNIRAYQARFLQNCTLINKMNSNAQKSETPIDFSSKIEPQPSTSKLIVDQKTPHSEKTIYTEIRKRARSSETGDTWTPTRSRETPLPPLTWANSTEVWQTMVYKEEATSRTRNCRLFEDPSSFLPRMRSILVDWVMEVCEVYHLRRITFYLALDYIDRYLTIKPSVPKHHLQLIGISALFVAAKLEEIYPPKLGEFSYVCDGACTDDDILDCEILLLNTLGWDVNPMTPTGWLNLYMQIYFDNMKEYDRTKKLQGDKRDFFFPQYSAYQFTRVSHLIDLFTLDPGYLLFNYSTIAAAAMYFYFGRSPALQVSGLIWDDLKDCTEYMAVFYATLRDANDPKLECVATQQPDERQEAAYKALKIWVPELVNDEGHSMQTHVVDLPYFEKATLLRLHRMGLRVRKTLIIKKKSSEKKELNGNNSPLSDSDDNMVPETGVHDDADKPVVMFHIEKMAPPTCELTPTAENTSQIDDDDIEYFTSKKTYTFDEILIGIHNCTNKVLLPRRLSEDVKLFDTN